MHTKQKYCNPNLRDWPRLLLLMVTHTTSMITTLRSSRNKTTRILPAIAPVVESASGISYYHSHIKVQCHRCIHNNHYSINDALLSMYTCTYYNYMYIHLASNSRIWIDGTAIYEKLVLVCMYIPAMLLTASVQFPPVYPS